ncbi:unnamed protein product [Penicillium glandicola]
MPTKKKAGGRKRDNEADLAELERLRKQVAEQSKALEAEEARKEEESQGKRQVSSRRQRTLVRWDVDTDIRLLLAIQYACNRTGVKIPWKEVAEAMGTKFTEGAIVQHLSKLRMKREEQDKEVPPPLKRAGNGSNKNGSANKRATPPSSTDSSGPTTRSTKRRRASDAESEEDVYTLKKKQFAKNPKKDKVFVAPKQQTKREGTDSNDSQNLVCVGAEWLQDFTGEDDHDVHGESDISESSTASSQATSQATKKSKVVTLKVGTERLASVDRSLGDSATFREPVTPTHLPRTITNMRPRHPSYFPYMHSEPLAPMSPVSPPFAVPVSIPFPSNGPSPFDWVNRAPTAMSAAMSAAMHDVAPGAVSTGVSAFDGMNLGGGYSQFDIPGDFQFVDQYSGQGMLTTGFEHQFMSDGERFANLPDVEPYPGFEGEDVKEF